MKKKTDFMNPDAPERSLDTSLPGREEEVIINKKEQAKPDTRAERPKVNNDTVGERRFKEGLQDNSNTENDN
jgi:hypothetical protein